MAGTIKVTTTITVVNGNYLKTFAPGTKTFVQTNVGATAGIVSVGTTEENILTTEVGTEGWVCLLNLDAANYVEWGASATTPTIATIGRLEAGEMAVFRMEPGTTLRAKADTAACEVEVWVLEN